MANYIVLDTETANLINYRDGQAHPETALVYDIGYLIANSSGETLNERSFIVSEVFAMRDRMDSAYYAEKLPQYREGGGLIDSSIWQIDSFLNIFQQFKQDCKDFNVKNIYAYNIKFDKTALNHTLRHLSNGYQKYFFPYVVKIKDIWDMAQVITCTKKYLLFCGKNDYVTAKGNPQTSAEVVYRYLSGKTEFKERHTALEDCYIENFILKKVKSRKKKTPKTIGQGWRVPAKKYKEL